MPLQGKLVIRGMWEGRRVFFRADAFHSYCVIWVPACSLKCHVSTSREELFRAPATSPLGWEELSDLWVKQLIQQCCAVDGTDWLVKVFPARSLAPKVLHTLPNVSWAQAAVLRIIPLLKSTAKLIPTADKEKGNN